MNTSGRLIFGTGSTSHPFIGKVWNAKRATFDGRDYWLGSIEQGTKLIAVSGPDDIDGTQESAIAFVRNVAQQRALGPIDIFVRRE